MGIEDWKSFVVTSGDRGRPDHVLGSVGDPSRARTRLGWEPEVSFKDLVTMMVENDLALLAAEGPVPSRPGLSG